MKNAFDNNLYVKIQSRKIRERISMFSKLYLEFGGKIFDDLHAGRVLPGFDVNVKTKLLKELKDQLEVIVCVNANDLANNKIRLDLNLTYDMETLRLVQNLRKEGILVSSIVLTLYEGQPSADTFKRKLELMGERVYLHRPTKGYPHDVETVVSDQGYGANPFVETSRPLVVVTAPGGGSGKLATCLSQLYHEKKMGVNAGFAKYESFPVWNLPLNHPVNTAYMAATADLNDYNLIDSYHLSATGEVAVTYNRDHEVFPIINSILTQISGRQVYASPTEMGVNMIASAITDDQAVREASKQEIIRRYYKELCEYKQGRADISVVERLQRLMSNAEISPTLRPVVAAAKEKGEKSGCNAVALSLPDGSIVTGRDNSAMNAAASAVLNGIKKMGGVRDSIKLIPTSAITPIIKLRRDVWKSKRRWLSLEEALIALSISVVSNPLAEECFPYLKQLQGCEAHSTVILEDHEMQIFRKMGINLTCEPEYSFTKK